MCVEFSVGQVTFNSQNRFNEALEYRVGYKHRFKSNTLLVQISIAPEHFDRHDMITLAQRLKKDFRHEQHLIVAICDEYNVANNPDVMDTLLIPPISLALRGIYELDRVNDKEGINFSTERGKPLGEIDIDLRAGQ
jgi:hypothetical protein